MVESLYPSNAAEFHPADAHPLRWAVRGRLAARLPRPLAGEDLDALLGAAARSRTPRRDRALLLLMRDGGLRPGEALGQSPAALGALREASRSEPRDHRPATEPQLARHPLLWPAECRERDDALVQREAACAVDGDALLGLGWPRSVVGQLGRALYAARLAALLRRARHRPGRLGRGARSSAATRLCMR